MNIAPLPFFYGCRKRRLKDQISFTATSEVFRILVKRSNTHMSSGHGIQRDKSEETTSTSELRFFLNKW
jgi:hypothetical protein